MVAEEIIRALTRMANAASDEDLDAITFELTAIADERKSSDTLGSEVLQVCEAIDDAIVLADKNDNREKAEQ